MPQAPIIAERRFWIAQVGFWVGFWLFEVFGSVEYLWSDGEPIDPIEVMLRSLLPTGIGFLMTIAFAQLFDRIKAQNEWVLLLVAGLACLLGAFLFSIVHFESKYWFGIYSESQLHKVIPVLLYTPSRFLILVSWSLAYLFLLFSGEANHHRERLAEMQRAASRSRADMLRYQMNPHLLFNALNTVSGHVLNKDVKSADVAIQCLSDLLRESLDDDEATDNRLIEEIDRVKLYLELERTRFGDRLRTKIEIPDGLYEVKLPKLLLQPLVENALKHGLARSSKGGELSILANAGGDHLSITVRNEMPAENSSDSFEPEGFGLGLVNVEERLELHYGGTATLEITEHSDNSFAVRVQIPLRSGDVA